MKDPIPRPNRSRRVLTPPSPDTLLLGPPELHLIGNNGALVTERLTLVATIEAPDTARAELVLYGICMDHAQHQRGDATQPSHWTHCLLSAPGYELLQALRESGEFPYPIDACPSEAEARWQLARAQGADTRERLPMRLYVEPASMTLREQLKLVLH